MKQVQKPQWENSTKPFCLFDLFFSFFFWGGLFAFYQTFKGKIIPMLLKLSQGYGKEEKLLNSYDDASI